MQKACKNMIFKHTSVLLTETIENLNINPVGIYIDGTLGGGGHAEEICKRLAPEGILIGIDRDKDALNAARIRLETYKCKKYFIQNNYSQVKDVISDIGIAAVDGAILDLGVSSFQLDNENRGFSYMKDAPLDMRMNGEDLFSAYDVINEYKEQELARIIKKYGEERWATRIAKFIVAERKEKNITTTGELVEIIKKAIPASARREGPHPAKRTFQAIRIEVNDELGQLEKAVYEFCDVLEEKGRLCIITFHSLEDRIVKKAFNERVNPCKCPPELPMCVCGEKADIRKITKKPITPTYLELEENPRSRSAKLRVVEKRGKENDDYGEKG